MEGNRVNQSKQYYKNIKKIFPKHGKKEREFLNDIKSQIEDYENENKSCTYLDYEQNFGTPVDVVISYYEMVDAKYLIKTMQIRKIIIWACIVVVTFIFIYLLWNLNILNKAYQDYYTSIPTSYDESIEEIN